MDFGNHQNGRTRNGLKAYMVDITPDSAVPTAISLSHLENVLAYFPG